MLKTTIVHEQKPVQSNITSTLQIPVYGKIYSLILRFLLSTGAPATPAQIRAQINNLRLTINGRDVVNVSAAKLFDTYASLGVSVQNPTGTNGVVELNVGRLIFNNIGQRDVFGWGTQNVTNIQVQVMAGTIPAAPNDIVSVQAYSTRTAEKETLGLFTKLMNYPQSFNATGDHTVDTLPRDPDSSYLAVLTDVGSAGVISHGECRVNNITITERNPSDVNAMQIAQNRLAQPTGYFAYLFTDGDVSSQLPMSGVTDLRFITTFSTAPGAQGYTMTALTISGLPVTAAA